MYTRFMDMHSGGGLKEPPYARIYIEAPENEAKIIFYNRFGHNPERVTCTCCGEDYSITEEDSLVEASAYDRNAAPVWFYKDTGKEATDGNIGNRDVKWDYDKRISTYKGREVEYRYVERPDLGHMKYGASKKECIDRYKTIEQYLDSEEVCVIYDEDIKDHERTGIVPKAGYVWIDDE